MVHLFKKVDVLLLVALLVPMLACGVLAQPTPTAAPPTATVTIAAPTATSAPVLSFVDHEESALGLSFRYPDSWEIEVDENSIVVASDVGLLSAEQFDREGAGALIVTDSADAFEGETLEDALNNAIQEFDFTENDQIVEGPQRLTINGQDAVSATIEGSNGDGGQALVVLVTLIRSGDRAAFVAGVTLKSVVDRYRTTLETITQSVALQDVQTAELDQSQGAIRYGETVEGRLETGEGLSWTFIGVQGERIDLTVRPLQEGLDLSVDVQDSAGASILPAGPQDDSFGVETIRGLVLPASAEYTVVVRGFAQASGTFELAIGEAGALSSAQSIEIGDTLNGSLELDEQEDYLFVNNQEEPVTIILNPVGDLDVVLEVLDAEGAIVFQEDSSYGEEQLSFTPDPSGSYILRVRGFAGAAGDYAIKLQAGGVGSTGTTLVVAATLEAGDSEGHDFPFTLDQNEVVQAIVTPDGEFDVVVEVWNDDTDQMLESVDASFGREQVNFTASQTGNYYFKVLGFEGQGGSYSITLSGSPAVIFELLPGDELTGDMGESAAITYFVRLDGGETLNASVTPDGETDVVLEVLDQQETVLGSVDDGFAGEAEQLNYTAPEGTADDSVFMLRVRNFSEEVGGTFTLTLE